MDNIAPAQDARKEAKPDRYLAERKPSPVNAGQGFLKFFPACSPEQKIQQAKSNEQTNKCVDGFLHGDMGILRQIMQKLPEAGGVYHGLERKAISGQGVVKSTAGSGHEVSGRAGPPRYGRVYG